MKINIDPSEPSTKRGFIWIIVGIVGLVMLLTGHKDNITALGLLGSIVAGGLGVTLKD
jgi:threonine/homoserine efflux transporter RhtA